MRQDETVSGRSEIVAGKSGGRFAFYDIRLDPQLLDLPNAGFKIVGFFKSIAE